ncbi:hypothetical protein [Rhizobium sp. RU36D]|uniref:hypothetical protein n=1 Tax=Rhizobium sp. RU36D TaxID=1907415 RepID=UPI0009D83050|nr:hypothetical protein [Rhizobium sp. RU36D]SMC40355.1 hypothetical protein SAMN05880593_10197 [Rhizobium sp. RU36D]
MADFVAVIRRAVDGLSNNTPEMRAKVYEKARGAVLRQLENMSPRPPEDMIRRQMDKLTAAITEVEAEHAVALPEVAEPVAYEPEPVHQEPEPVAAASEPAYQEPEPEPAASDYDYGRHEPAPDDYSAPVENLPSADIDPQPAYADRNFPAPAERPSPAFATADDWMSEPYGVRKDEPVAVTPAAAAPVEPVVAPAPAPDLRYEEPVVAPVEEKPAPVSFFDEPAPVPAPVAEARVMPLFPDEPPAIETREPSRTETEVAYDAWASFPASGTPAQGSHDLGTELDWPAEPPAAVPPRETSSVESDFDAFLNSVKSIDTAKTTTPPPAMPAAGIDLLDWHDELASLPSLSATAPAAAAQPAAKPAVKQAPAPIVVPKNESFDDLLDSSLSGPAAPVAMPAAGAKGDGADIDDFLASAPQTAYRKESKPRRNFVPLILGLAVVILLGGGGYAVWANRAEINDFFASLTQSSPDAATTDNAAETPQSTPASSEPTTPATDTAAAPVTGAPEEGVATVQKFTQRLRADGTEIDEGAAGANGATGEGRSVAQQTVASSGDPAATPSPSATTPPAATDTAPPAGANAPLTVGSQEKAFLYEERLGQVSPTAIVGGIEWTAMRESGADGRPDPAIQGKLSIPERGLNALITFRRNNDSSLPASHLVEIVFSMPADFEGGAIDAVQRVSLKRTEQDRGDPLVGVAAKVTDDTFLIALNDFQDVVARNMDLISNRSWIDIPITYRNGRRALLTLDKGSNGTALFQQVVREWSALTPAAPAN